MVFVIKQFAFQLLEVGVPWMNAAKEAKIREAKLEVARKKARKVRLEAIEAGEDPAVVKTAHTSGIEEESEMAPYPAVFADYNELAIQFGYSTLFGAPHCATARRRRISFFVNTFLQLTDRCDSFTAVAFPCAPLLAMINNWIEMRSDAYKLCKVHRRPEYQTRSDIGAWETVFETIAVASVVTNALLIGIVGSQMSDYFTDDHTPQSERFTGENRLCPPSTFR